MTLIDFIKEFPEEESCKLKFKHYRERVGVVCPKCGGESHYWKSDKDSYECKNCGYRRSLRANTIMHGSQLPFRYRFVSIHLVTSTKKSFSANEIQRQLGHNRYHPIWHMMHKIRSAMGNRDGEYVLGCRIELDEEYFSTKISEKEKDKPLKRGRGSQKKSKVLVMAESEFVQSSKKRAKDSPCGLSENESIMKHGKKVCNVLKEIRQQIADKKDVV